MGSSLLERSSSSFVLVASLRSLFDHRFNNQKQKKLSFSPILVPLEKRRLHSTNIGSSLPLLTASLETLLGWQGQQNGILPFQVPKTNSHKIKNKWFVKQSFQHHSPRLSALPDDQKSMEKLLDEHKRSKCKSSLRSQDGYTGQTGLSKAINTFLLFTRPYASFGIIVGIISASLIPVETISDLSPNFFLGVLQAVIARMLMQTYVSGINHLYDVEIDKSFGIGFMSQSAALLCGLLMHFIIGSAYSIDLPFLRWKRNPILAALSIVFLHSLSVYIPNFINVQRYLLGRSIVITKPVLLTTVVMCIHSIAVAILKDISDTEGDKENGIKTFSTELGRKKAFFLGISVLLIEYGIAIIVGAFSASTLFSKFVSVAGHVVLALALWFRSRSVDVMNNSAAFSFYMFIWKLFYAGNVLILFYR
ncbi:probable homogentisate phytyltransferase 1, chloroplastic isoform X2 [Macadamia integrifolia]|uniref:probable homogentisate phytyltransferase 1, chloroplastic isoform X2 n=1 Tax=Macadamia integrifolia TaxID=60698 RepID=UPI001C4F02E1|nr:probable homogentisate phytyltransferase 1, chloroplastic isoform X2 [Macadamia integrifolia]